MAWWCSAAVFGTAFRGQMAKFKFPLRAHLSGRKEALLWGGGREHDECRGGMVRAGRGGEDGVVPVTSGVFRQPRKQVQLRARARLWARTLGRLQACQPRPTKVFLQGDAAASRLKP